jgi:predicted ATP-grasp superfamily ATP-dependent carboligase
MPNGGLGSAAARPGVLVTSSRFPYSLALIRAFGEAGRDVVAADSVSHAPGSHSRFVSAHVLVAAPALHPSSFAADVAAAAAEHGAGLVIAPFEDAFHLAQRREALPQGTRLFADRFDTLLALHDKAAFAQRCAQLGVPAPRSESVTSPEDLRLAVGRFERWVAKPAFSRAGIDQATNVGPRNGELDLAACRPTEAGPWLVQEYVEGRDLSSLSIACDGRIVLHCAYELPASAAGGYGLSYRSISDSGTLAIAEAIADAAAYTGFLGLDYRLGSDLRVIECNPRCTPGALVFEHSQLVAAILDPPPGNPLVAPPGRRFEFGSLLAREALRHPSTLPRTIHDLLTTPDAFGAVDDPLPLLYRFVAIHHDERVAARTRASYAQAFLGDLVWDPGGS